MASIVETYMIFTVPKRFAFIRIEYLAESTESPLYSVREINAQGYFPAFHSEYHVKDAEVIFFMRTDFPCGLIHTG